MGTNFNSKILQILIASLIFKLSQFGKEFWLPNTLFSKEATIVLIMGWV